MVLSIALSEGGAIEEGTRGQVCIRGMYGGMKMRGVRCVCVLVREPRGYIGRCASVFPADRRARNSKGDEEGEGRERKDRMDC